MEYNKTKMNLEKAASILGIISASLYIILSFILLFVAFMYFGGAYDYTHDYIVGYYGYNEPIYATKYYDMSSLGWGFLIPGLLIMTISILMLIFSVKLVKSPYLPNGELKNKKAARIWLLVLSIITGGLVIVGLMIAVLCLKDYKQPKVIMSNNVSRPTMNITTAYTNDYYEFYDKIQEVKKLKSLGIIDDVAFKKAITKIVTDIAK